MTDTQTSTDGHSAFVKVLVVLLGLCLLLTLGTLAAAETSTQQTNDTEELRVDATSFVEPGGSGTYEVTAVYYDEEESRNVTVDVTDAADVSIESDAVSQWGSGEFDISDNDELSERFNVTAEYDGLTATDEVAVGELDIANLETLPPWYRIAAMLDSSTVQMILIAIFAGVAATWIATAFAGIGAIQIVVTVGWFAGYIPTGIMLVGLFSAMFIGFNLAANIDYTVRR